MRAMIIPGDDDEEIHDVPDVAQIGAAMEDEAEGQDLEARLDAEYGEEVDLGGLELLGEGGLVVAWQMFLEGEHDAVGDDGQEDGVLEGRPLDYEPRVLPYAVILAQYEQGRGALADPVPRPSTLIPAWRHHH